MANIDRQIFPIFHLLTKSLKLSIQLIDPLEKLGFSTLSNRAGHFVKTSKFKILKFFAEFSCLFVLKITSDDMRQAEVLFRNNIDDVEGVQTWVETTYTDTRNWVTWKDLFLSRREWIMHFLSVLNRDSIDSLCYAETYWPFSSVETVFKSLKLNNIELFTDSPDIQRFLRSIPLTDGIDILGAIPDKEFLKLTVQNFDYIYVSSQQKLTLDTLLSVNIVCFDAFRTDLTPRDLNRFIKLWLRNSNSRLRRLQVRFTSATGNDGEAIMRGIKYEEQQHDKHFYSNRSGTQEYEEVIDGLEICRKFGTQATIIIHDPDIFKMFIWSQ